MLFDLCVEGVFYKLLLLAIFCFVDSQIYICDFHLEQASDRWLAKSRDRKQSVLVKLRAVARARTENEYLERLDYLKESEEWKANSNLRNYMTKTWLPQYKAHLSKKILLLFPLSKANFLLSLQK